MISDMKDMEIGLSAHLGDEVDKEIKVKRTRSSQERGMMDDAYHLRCNSCVHSTDLYHRARR